MVCVCTSFHTGDDTRTLKGRYSVFGHSLIKFSNTVINSHDHFQEYGKEADGSLDHVQLLQDVFARTNVRTASKYLTLDG